MRTVLGAVLVIGTLAACSSGGGGKQSASTSTSGTAAPTTSRLRGPDQQLGAFRAPSGNIGCELVATQVARCDIRDHSWAPPPKPADCDLDWGFGLQVATTGQAGFVCAGDTAVDPASPVLTYGQRARQGSFVCESAETGVTCTNEATGRGFFLSRESYRIF